MTIAADDPIVHPAPHGDDLMWATPAPGLWVGETADAYLGMVDRCDDGFVATAADGHELGVHATLTAAQAAVRSASHPSPLTKESSWSL
jgi:hypothetical protein